MQQRPYMLIADDDQDDVYLLDSAFKDIEISVNVHYVRNGVEVLRYLDGINDPGRFPSLIVLDLNMPLLSGRDTLLRLKTDLRYQHIPVVILTTSLNEVEKAQCLGLGAARYLFKSHGYEKIVGTARFLYEFSAAAC